MNYALAGSWADTVHALFMGESGEQSNPPLGDGGRAFGPGQQHPSFFIQYYGRYGYVADVTDTWDDAEIKAAAAFLTHCESFGLSLDLSVQAYNLGISAIMTGERNETYLLRFTENLQRVRGGKAS